MSVESEHILSFKQLAGVLGILLILTGVTILVSTIELGWLHVWAALLVAENSPLDQYIVAHPEYFFGQAPEAATLNADNPHILASHLSCAAFEFPLGGEEAFGGGETAPHLEAMEREGKLHRSGGAWHWVGGTYPAADVMNRRR